MSKKYRVFTAEFKLAAIERMEAGGNTLALARELGIQRQLLYKWKAAFDAGGAEGLIRKRPGPKPKGTEPPPRERPAVSEAERLRARVLELERLAGRQAMELDFFEAALREVGVASRRKKRLGGTASTPSSGSGRARKAD
jgi:transposase